MKIQNEVFLAKPLRVHSLLAGVPLLDVWSVELHGGDEGLTLQDLRQVLAEKQPKLNPMARGLFGLRAWMGRLFGWDKIAAPNAPIPPQSYILRLTDEDRARSFEPPNWRYGAFRVLYAFDHEAAAEIINATTQAFLHVSLEAAPQGYTATLAIYAIRTKWWSRFYFWLIEPFRMWIIYPALLRGIQKAWAGKYG